MKPSCFEPGLREGGARSIFLNMPTVKQGPIRHSLYNVFDSMTRSGIIVVHGASALPLNPHYSLALSVGSLLKDQIADMTKRSF